jgi:hypothetical protein
MVYFLTKNPNLGTFLRALNCEILIRFMAIWNILWTFVTFYNHWVHFVVLWYIFSFFGITHQEKSGNPEGESVFNLPRKKCAFAVRTFVG